MDGNVEWDGLRFDSRDSLYKVPQGAVGDTGGASTERLIISSTWPRTSAGKVWVAICCAVAEPTLDVSNAASSPRHGPVLAMVFAPEAVPRQRNRSAFVPGAPAIPLQLAPTKTEDNDAAVRAAQEWIDKSFE